MNYIYDIYLNFNDVALDFFEWNKNDKLTHLKKIPIIKISKEDFKIICYHKFKIDINILNRIKDKTEIWKSKNNIKYCCLFCCDSAILCVKFNKKGISEKKSFLFVDEELEILDSINTFNKEKINYKILRNDKLLFKTRLQLEKDRFIKEKIKNIKNDELKYIYYECFNKYSNKDKMILDINNMNKNGIQYENLYNILKLISTIKK